jgi:hypothetical protein
MKLKSNFAIIRSVLCSAVLIPLAGQAQDQAVLLNIYNGSYHAATANNFISDASLFGYTLGISPLDSVSGWDAGWNGATTGGTFSGGQTISLSYSVGGWAENLPTPTPTAPEALADEYLYNNHSPSTPCTVSLGNLNLQANSTYTLLVYGWINGGNENSMLQPLNDNAGIVYNNTTATTSGFLAVQFSTTSSYVNSDALDFAWANQGGQGDGVLNGMAIVPAPEPSSLALALAGGAAVMGLSVYRRKHQTNLSGRSA